MLARFELCIDRLDSLEEFAGTVHSIELCSSLEQGGLTPSPALFLLAVQKLLLKQGREDEDRTSERRECDPREGTKRKGTPKANESTTTDFPSKLKLDSALTERHSNKHTKMTNGTDVLDATLETHLNVLVRCRAGHFVYTLTEKQTMIADCEWFAKKGATGIVVGALTADGNVDEEFVRDVLNCVGSQTKVTFHRALDVAVDYDQAIETCIKLGVHRVLTSGGAQTAWEGRERIASWVDKCHRRGVVLAVGGGVTETNCVDLICATRCKELHGSLREADENTPTKVFIPNPFIPMGLNDTSDYVSRTASQRRVAVVMSLLRKSEKKV